MQRRLSEQSLQLPLHWESPGLLYEAPQVTQDRQHALEEKISKLLQGAAQGTVT